MKAKYDSDEIELSQAYVDALREVLVAEVEMMQMQEADSELADCWHWGRAYIGDLAKGHSVGFYYGHEQDMPDDGLGRFAVIITDCQ